MTGGGDASVAEFVGDLTFTDLPAQVVRDAERCLLDLLGVAAAGQGTRLSSIAREHVVRWLPAGPGGGARLLFDGRRVSPVGAAFAGAATIDSLDAHDGHALAKGHAGVAVLPALLALADLRSGIEGTELLTTLVLGYEVAIRAGIALHDTAGDYHSSGAWNALGAAAVGARLLGLGTAAIDEALGIAEYHAPRGPMMRCIDHPAMVKDGSAAGAAAGVCAVLLAADGFTGAPAELTRHPMLWSDLGQRWRILEQYLKPYPVCRWAHPAVDATLRLRPDDAGDIAAVDVLTFGAATRLSCRVPSTTEQAQYSLAFPVAAALVRGDLGLSEISGSALADPEILRLAESMTIRESPAYTAGFPAIRRARVTIELVDGRVVTADADGATGDPTSPLSDADLASKFHRFVHPVLGQRRADRIEAGVDALRAPGSASQLLNDVLRGPLPRV
ncbi:MmgE/PrpD family protein [soil metagenome]